MYRSKADSEQANSAEYGKSKPHNYVKSNRLRDVYMDLGTENRIVCSLTYQNRQVQVTLAFPEQTDTKAEQDFVSRLKMVYLEKIKTEACQRRIWRYHLPPRRKRTKEKEENGHA